MALDGVIDALKRHDTYTEVWLRPRIDSEGQRSIAGQRRVLISVNPNYTPQTGDQLWGGVGFAVISKDGVDHRFDRLVQPMEKK
jgi:hypothetical protein